MQKLHSSNRDMKRFKIKQQVSLTFEYTCIKAAVCWFGAGKINLSRPVALAAVRSKAVVLLLLIHSLLLNPLFVGVVFGHVIVCSN